MVVFAMFWRVLQCVLPLLAWPMLLTIIRLTVCLCPTRRVSLNLALRHPIPPDATRTDHPCADLLITDGIAV